MVTKVYKIITGRASYRKRLEFFDFFFLLKRIDWSYCLEGYAIPKFFLVPRFAGFRLTPPLPNGNRFAALPIGARLYGKNVAKA